MPEIPLLFSLLWPSASTLQRLIENGGRGAARLRRIVERVVVLLPGVVVGNSQGEFFLPVPLHTDVTVGVAARLDWRILVEAIVVRAAQARQELQARRHVAGPAQSQLVARDDEARRRRADA